jgi:hypothetical protein
MGQSESKLHLQTNNKPFITSVNPYFNFMGNTEEILNFYKSIFGGEFTTLTRFKDGPGHEKYRSRSTKTFSCRNCGVENFPKFFTFIISSVLPNLNPFLLWKCT